MTSNRLLVALVVTAALDVACGGSGGGSPGPGGATGTTGPTGGAALQGIALPKEVSALPPGAATPPAIRGGALLQGAVALTPPAPAGSDLANAKTFKYVSERALGQFDVLNTIFTALAQTHYDDPAVLNQGTYAAIVTWEDKGEQGQMEKRLVRWVVESTRASETSSNVVKAWFQMPMKQNQVNTIQANIEITTAPTVAADGSYLDYGIWRMDVKVVEDFPFRFVASAERDEQGRAVVRLLQAEPGPGVLPTETRGVLVRSAESGSGKVSFPDWELCQSPDCVPPPAEVAYVYDPQIVTLRKNQSAPTTKSRHVFVDVVNRYGLFDAQTGADVNRTLRFGFPVRATVNGGEVFGYYGAWQGRHQLWANGASVPAGQEMVRADVGPGQSAARYIASPEFRGILVKRSYAPARLSDLTGLVVETWDNRNFQLGFDGTGWCTQPQMSFGQSGPVASCGPGSTPFTNSDWAALELNPNDLRRNVGIGNWDNVRQQQVNYVYEKNGPGGPGLYEALMVPGLPHPTRTGSVPAVLPAGSQLWVNVGGSIFVSYDGQGWVRKAVASFDDQTWTPTFVPGGDVPYELQPGREYYFNNSGTSYIAKLDGGITTVQLEIQAVANPRNAPTFVPAGTTFTQQWCGMTACATFEFVTDPASPKFMKLVYKSVSEADNKSNHAVGDVVENGLYGIQATLDGSVVQFNWDYPQDGQKCGGVQQFLRDAADAYVMLDDPLRLGTLSLTNAASVTRLFTLQFDGNWMQGLPNVWDDLRNAGFQATDAIQQKNFSIPDGTVLGGYVVKQLQVAEYMAASSAAPLSLAPTVGISLATVPQFVDHALGPMPAGAPLKYSEGKPVVAP